MTLAWGKAFDSPVTQRDILHNETKRSIEHVTYKNLESLMNGCMLSIC